MAAFEWQDGPCYSARLLGPFLEALREEHGLDPGTLGQVAGVDPDDRFPVKRAHELLEGAVEWAGDPDLGLKASRRVSLGDVGTLDYTMSSCSTVREAVEASARYMRLVGDHVDVQLESTGEYAEVRLHNSVFLPRAAEDFQVGALFEVHARSWLGRHLSELEVCLSYEPPDDTRELERRFAPASLRFEAAHPGFRFPATYLDAPLRRGDAKLHSIVREHAERLLAELPSTKSLTEQVRALLAEELPEGPPKAAHMARRLGMSARTLTRKLEREGTSLKWLADDLRRRLALRYVGTDGLALSEVALRLGFSDTSAFHRAFRRWTGQTPTQYRRSQNR